MAMRIAMFALVTTGIFSGSALAEKLPKDAVKVPSGELQEIYAGKSATWSKSNAYFAPDGTYLSARRSGDSYGQGQWAINGNRVCADFTVTFIKDGSKKTFRNCWTWYKRGGTYWTQFSLDEDEKDSFYDDEIKKLSKGDKVSKMIQKLASN